MLRLIEHSEGIMSQTKQKRASDDQMDKAREIYTRVIVPTLKDENPAKIVAIDVETEDYEIGDDLLAVCQSLKARRPHANIHGFRLGGGAIDRFGASRTEDR